MGAGTTSSSSMACRVLLAAALAWAPGCGDDAAAPADAGDRQDAAAVCSTDRECDDGRFCTGEAICDPASLEADRFGCVREAGPCLEAQRCDEDSDRCLTECALTGDADGDGHRARDCGGDDCDDADPRRYPGNAEVCDPDGRDEDCDPATFGERDEDGDGALSDECCNVQPDGSSLCGEDCNDRSLAQRPDQLEICDSADNDCDGAVDEEMNEVPWYPDDDGDGFGGTGSSTTSCVPVEGRSLLSTDCDDTDAASNPAGVEMCDGLDNDCDGTLDEGHPTGDWYPDMDSDGFGAEGSSPTASCAPIPGHSMIDTDCDDTDVKVNVLALETCNGADDDCDGLVDEAPCSTGPLDGGVAADGGAGDAGMDAGSAL